MLAGLAELFGVALFKFDEDRPAAKITFFPRLTMVDGIEFAEVCFGGFAASIKVGEGQMPDGFDAMRIASDHCYIAQTPFTGSRWEDAARRALLNADLGSPVQGGS